MLFPTVLLQLEKATELQDSLKIKACLFSICTSLVVIFSSFVFYMNIFSDLSMHYQLDYFCTLQIFRHLQVRGWESFSHSVTPKIRKVLENILLWPSVEDESKTQTSGC